jgi:hypothetical protein
MERKVKFLLILILLVTFVLAFVPVASAMRDDWVVVCHNPGLQSHRPYTNQKVLVVSPGAAEAHLAHGDHLGWCVWLYPW